MQIYVILPVYKTVVKQRHKHKTIKPHLNTQIKLVCFEKGFERKYFAKSMCANII